MLNNFDSHIRNLTALASSEAPVVSIFVPLISAELPSVKILAALLRVANRLLTSEGHPPITVSTLDWKRWEQQGSATLSLFIGGGVTTVIPLPLRLPPRVVVARSFHIKPLVAAREYVVGALLVHFSDRGASVYNVSTGDEVLLETYLPARSKVPLDWGQLSRGEKREFLEFLLSEIQGLRTPEVAFIGISNAGDSLLSSPGVWGSLGLEVIDVEERTRAQVPQNAISILRLRVGKIINDRYRRRVKEAYVDEDKSLATIEDLGPRILKRELRSLCVSLEDMQFGVVDTTSGLVGLHRAQSDCQDDDVLDDLVELALRNDIQVSVVPRAFLPPGRTFVAS